jgi:hypothetical protein
MLRIRSTREMGIGVYWRGGADSDQWPPSMNT